MKGNIITFEEVQSKLVQIRGQKVLLDYAVAELYGVETKRINEAVRNNPEKFPEGYVLELNNDESSVLRTNLMTKNIPDNQESAFLKSKISTLETGRGKYSKYNYKAFTERGLYMLATILKSKQAVTTTIAIIEAFAKLRELSRTIGEMTSNPDEYQQKSLMQKSGEIIDDLFGDSLTTNETETEIELNFAVLKLKHTIKRKK